MIAAFLGISTRSPAGISTMPSAEFSGISKFFKDFDFFPFRALAALGISSFT